MLMVFIWYFMMKRIRVKSGYMVPELEAQFCVWNDQLEEKFSMVTLTTWGILMIVMNLVHFSNNWEYLRNDSVVTI